MSVGVRYGREPDPDRRDDSPVQPKPASSGNAAPEDIEQGPMGPVPPARYRCASCEEPIATERVIRIEAEPGRASGKTPSGRGTSGFMLITHVCPCSPLALTTRRYRSYKAFVAMFGRGVNLPYESPFRPAVIADDHPSVLAWRWELGQTVDIEDFLYWLEHRRS